MSLKSLIRKILINKILRHLNQRILGFLLSYDTKYTLNYIFGKTMEELSKDNIARQLDYGKYESALISYLKKFGTASLPALIIDTLPQVFPDNNWAPQYRNHKLITKVLDQTKKISFSQSGEDILMRYIFDQLQIENPSYLDIGAHHPYYISNTALFYLSGSRGVNIEPDPSLINRFIEARPEDINLNIAISDKDGIADLMIFGESTLNTLSNVEAEDYVKEGISLNRKISVQTRSIKSILKEYCNNVFPDILSLDVEGLDLDILKQIDYEVTAPIVICVESISYSNSGRGIKRTEITDYLKNFGYMIYADTNINSILVKQDRWER